MVYANRGEIWRLKGDLDRALADQDQSVRLDPKSPLPFLSRGDTYRYRGELNRALADYDQALRVTPDYIPAFVGRGLTFEKAGDIARARAEYDKALNSKSQFRGDNAGSSAGDRACAARRVRFRRGAAGDSGGADAGHVADLDPDAGRRRFRAVARLEPGKLGRRVALVIGNADYTSAGRLNNPRARRAMSSAASLRAIGFETVTVANDATREKMTDALRAFSSEAEKADWAVVYYSGHGMEVNGTNYLVPVDAKISGRPRRVIRGGVARSGDGRGRGRAQAQAGPARRLPQQPVRAADAAARRPATPVTAVASTAVRHGRRPRRSAAASAP